MCKKLKLQWSCLPYASGQGVVWLSFSFITRYSTDAGNRLKLLVTSIEILVSIDLPTLESWYQIPCSNGQLPASAQGPVSQ